ncbi:MAG: patatin-like phospholipase family protein [Desulfobacteraceae bacterium]|nr:patatin-like phospholipase family protein [Desulfobacteraceae bacterium]MCB9494792.1 patatin-like phospholipase family protein [Desulfobacteraceae bacterium]
MEKKMSTALILGGGAPNSTLMAGALSAFIEENVKFDVISTSGAGALIGLFYTVPKNTSPKKALENSVNFSISDFIYDMLPVNYKVFNKPGKAADLYRDLIYSNPFLSKILEHPPENDYQRLFQDFFSLFINTICPTDLNYLSKGLCANVPFVEKVVDFDKLKNIREDFYINAYNINKMEMENFSKNEITPDHFHASFAFPFIYPPYEMNNNFYFEGASVDALNYKSLINNHPEVDTIVVFDILGTEKIIRQPRNIYDAWVVSIMVPLVEIARDDTKIFELKYNTGKDKRKLLKVPFNVPESQWPYVLDWSYSNLKTLYDAGYESGKEFVQKNRKDLNFN